MSIFKNKFNYQKLMYLNHHNDDGYWIFADLTHKKYKFYFTYNLNNEIKIKENLSKQWKILNKIMLFLIIISLLFMIIKPLTVSSNLYEKYYITSRSPITNIRSSPYIVSLDSIQIAFEKIDNKKYNEALDILQKIKNKDVNIHFYMGISYQEIGKYQNAINEYETIINNYNEFFIESQWYLGLCYLKINENKKALKQFEKLSEYTSCYQLPSKEIIEKIE